VNEDHEMMQPAGRVKNGLDPTARHYCGESVHLLPERGRGQHPPMLESTGAAPLKKRLPRFFRH
jgi:hypothetical protein